MKYMINYRQEGSMFRVVEGDKLRIDGNVAMILSLIDADKYRVVAIFNMEAIKEIVEEK